MAGKAAQFARVFARLTPEQQLEVMGGRPSRTTVSVAEDIARDEMTRRPILNRAERRRAARRGEA